MAHIINNTRRIAVKVFREFFALWKNYGFSPAFYTLVWWLNFYLPTPWRFRMSKWALLKKTVWLSHYIETRWSETINKYRENLADGRISEKERKIWVFWAQGEEKMPVLVKACYEALCHNNANVELVTLQNFDNYVGLPVELRMLAEAGDLSWAHFSDILRTRLLYEHGGLWVDATVMTASEIPFERLMEMRFFSPGAGKPHLTGSNNCFWTTLDNSWSTWCMWSNCRKYPLFGFVSEMMEKFALSGKAWPDYVLQDFLIYYGLQNFSDVRNDFRLSEKIVCEGRNRLAQLMSQEYDEEVYRQLCESDFVFKLSFRTLWPSKTADGKTTYYGKLIEKL